ncbi:MAG: amidohydrolase [Candidatus Hydrothermae bacterium]|nr:amidohydrolase [Candidatus Hydrothermae bacterium]
MLLRLLKNAKIFYRGSFKKHLGILINGEIIEYLPRESEFKYLNPLVDELDLQNYRVIPGFIDTHTHMVGHGLSLMESKVDHVNSKEDLLDFIAEDVKNRKEEIYIYSDFDESTWKKSEPPTREELDKISSKPVFLRRICGHFGIGNSAFLEKCLSLKEIRKDKIDSQRGFFYEDIPLKLYTLFPPTTERLKQAILKAQYEFLKNGITSIHEFGSPAYFKAYEELESEGKLKIRVYFSFYERYLEDVIKSGLISGFGNNRLKMGGIKLFADGSVGAETAYFSFKYGEKGSRGILLFDEDKLTEIMHKAENSGLRLLVHAIGDAAIETVLKVYEKSRNPDLHRIEHFEFPTKSSIERAQRLQVQISLQPNFTGKWGGTGGMYEKKLGKRWVLNNPIKTLLQSDVIFAFGSDAMPPDPLFGINSAINHPVEKERIDTETAISLYTEKAAFLSFENTVKGRIEENCLSDLVVIDENLKEVKMVFIGGECIYDGRGN